MNPKEGNMRKKIVAGNWKMNMLPSETPAFIDKFKGRVPSDRDVVFCVPFTHISTAVEAAKGTGIEIAAQNFYLEDSGAFTGEISGAMLKDLGASYVVLGHSERREIFGETDEIVNKKVLKALQTGLKPILCVGEKLEERKQNVTIELVRLQTKIGLQGVDKTQAKDVVIAYEPVWAIGTGLVATNEQAEEVCKAIRELLAEIYDEATANAVRIQYGGSVNEGNAKDLFAMPNIDGGLVGGASLKEEFTHVINA